MRIVELALACAVAMTGAVAVNPAAAQAPAATDALLQRVKQRGVMRACATAYLPWNIKNPITETWEGINADVTTELAKSLGVKVEYVDVTWATVIPSLQSDKCDVNRRPKRTPHRRAIGTPFRRSLTEAVICPGAVRRRGRPQPRSALFTPCS